VSGVTPVTRAWRELLPFMDAHELRELLGERGAFELHQRGAGTGDREAVAEVLTAIYGADPMALVR